MKSLREYCYRLLQNKISYFFLFLFVLSSDCRSGRPNLIRSMQVSKNRIEVKVNRGFKRRYLNSDFFAVYGDDINLHRLDESILSMPFIMNVISIVWISGEHYKIQSMDKELYYSLKKIKQVFKRMYPRTRWDGDLHPDKLVTNKPVFPARVEQHKDDIALLFSGGLDSITASLRNKDKHQLLITARGHCDSPKQLGDWRKLKQRLEYFGKGYGHEALTLYSNYWYMLKRRVLDSLTPEITTWRLQVVEGLGWAGLTAPILALKGYPVLFIASSISYRCPYVMATNPFLDDNIKFAGIRLHHDCFDFDRIDKYKFLSEYFQNNPDQKKPYILSCSRPGIFNCLNCSKCHMSLCGLLVNGDTPRDYGYPINVEDAIEWVKKTIFRLAVGHAYQYLSMQDHIKNLVANGTEITPFAQWYLNFDFTSIRNRDRRYKNKIDWRKLLDLLPESFYKYAAHETLLK